MSAKIFYRERIKSKEGSKSPRYRIIAISGIDLKVYADHLRFTELEQLAEATGAELIAMKRGKKHR